MPAVDTVPVSAPGAVLSSERLERIQSVPQKSGTAGRDAPVRNLSGHGADGTGDFRRTAALGKTVPDCRMCCLGGGGGSGCRSVFGSVFPLAQSAEGGIPNPGGRDEEIPLSGRAQKSCSRALYRLRERSVGVRAVPSEGAPSARVCTGFPGTRMHSSARDGPYLQAGSLAADGGESCSGAALAESAGVVCEGFDGEGH